MMGAVSGTHPMRHLYGPDPSQFADLYLPAGQPRPITVVLVHGGWWGPHYGLDHLEQEAVDLARRGWVTWNIEYRRIGIGGGYPSTLEDAAAAVDYLATMNNVSTDQVVTMGHSAGGHLATWAAGRSKLAVGAPGAKPVVEIAGVISLAGVVDLGAAARDRSGNSAAIKLMGGRPDEHPDWYAVADPLTRVPIPAVVRCVHARADDEVPFSESVTYVAAAQAAGQDASLIEASGDHYSVADATSADWPAIIDALEELETLLA
ncbi:MAG TPA: alpha/beta hydrolase [Acidothermaceae bacterium]